MRLQEHLAHGFSDNNLGWGSVALGANCSSPLQDFGSLLRGEKQESSPNFHKLRYFPSSWLCDATERTGGGNRTRRLQPIATSPPVPEARPLEQEVPLHSQGLHDPLLPFSLNSQGRGGSGGSLPTSLVSTHSCLTLTLALSCPWDRESFSRESFLFLRTSFFS